MSIDRAQSKPETTRHRFVDLRCFAAARRCRHIAARLAVLLLVCHAALAIVAGSSVHSSRPKYRIIAYVYGQTSIYAIDASQLTHVNYAFALVSAAGEV